MRIPKYVCLAMGLLLPTVLYAGQIYGSITSGGKGVAQANIEINCSGAISKGVSAPDGAYRILVPQEGQCTLTLPGYAGRPSAVIFSNPNPLLYNFELVQRNDGSYELKKK